MTQGQQTLIDACIASHVPRYIASDYSFDFRGFKLGDFPGKDFCLTTQAYLAEKEGRGEVKGVHVLNGAFTEYVFSPFLGVYNAAKDESRGEGAGAVFKYWGTGDEKWDMTSMPDAAKFTVEVACDEGANGVQKGMSLCPP